VELAFKHQNRFAWIADAQGRSDTQSGQTLRCRDSF
jgi:hypothetical protein